MLLSNTDGFILSVILVFSKVVFKNLLRIHNIKLNKLMVIKTNYAIKFILNIKNKKSKLNNIHYKLNVFQKKY